MEIKIEKYTDESKISIHSLWEFIEDNLHKKEFPSPMYWINEREIHCLKNKNNIFLAIYRGIMIGCIIVKASEIKILCVKRRFRRKGVGKKLVNHIEQIMRKDKRKKQISVSSCYQFKAKSFYERLGFNVDYNDKFERTWELKKGL